MIIAVASGKGGTGKTTVATSLVLSIAADAQGVRPLFLDCDVEEPNAALFLKPSLDEGVEVGIPIPEIDFDKCTFCGRCAEVCVWHAIAVVGQRVLVFPELCHGCGSCTLNCPENAISERLHVMGTVESGPAGPIDFAHGTLNIGEAMAGPVIHRLKQMHLQDTHERVAILDAPPGTACPVVETIRGADFVLLVTEPTPFGLHDLKMAVEVARDEMGLPVGVVINRDGIGDAQVDAYCAREGIPILMRIPHDRRIAQAHSDGLPLIEVAPAYRESFKELCEQVRSLASGHASQREAQP